MAHCVKVVLDDVCTKSLQQEEALHSSGHTLITLSNVTASNRHLREDSFYTYPERETPRMIGKVLGYFNYFKVYSGYPLLYDSLTSEVSGVTQLKQMCSR